MYHHCLPSSTEANKEQFTKKYRGTGPNKNRYVLTFLNCSIRLVINAENRQVVTSQETSTCSELLCSKTFHKESYQLAVPVTAVKLCHTIWLFKKKTIQNKESYFIFKLMLLFVCEIKEGFIVGQDNIKNHKLEYKLSQN